MGAAGPVQEPDCVGGESRGRGASTALAYPPTTPIPQARPGVGAAGPVQQFECVGRESRGGGGAGR